MGASDARTQARVRADDRTRHLPVIVFTTLNEKRAIEQAYRPGANSYVHTPVDLDQYIQTIKQVGAYWLGLNETLTV